MADEKVRRAFDGSPLPPYSEAIVDEPNPEPYPSQTHFRTRDGRWAAEGEAGRFYLVDADGHPDLSRPVAADQVIL